LIHCYDWPDGELKVVASRIKKVDSKMPRVLKAKRGTRVKAKANRRPEAKRTTIKRSKPKTQKKTKMQTITRRRGEPLKLPGEVKPDEPKTTTAQIPAPEKSPDPPEPVASPAISYALEVDGRLKSEYPTQQSAMMAATELKRKYPQIRVAIIDSKERKRVTVELPLTAA
jgi:hypothetical protein